MKISIIAGSHRRESESMRVAQYIQGVLGRIGIDQTYLLSLSDNPLPLWDEGMGRRCEVGGLMDTDCRGVTKLRRFRNRLPGVVGNGPGRAEELLLAVWR